MLGQDAEAAADLEHDVVRRQLGSAGDDAQQIVVDQEVLAELAIGVNVVPAQAARLACRGSRLTTREDPPGVVLDLVSSSPYPTPRSSATQRAVCVTLAGSLALPRTGCGARKGASVSTSSSSAGRARAAVWSSVAWIGDVAGERAEVAVLGLHQSGAEAMEDHRRDLASVLA